MILTTCGSRQLDRRMLIRRILVLGKILDCGLLKTFISPLSEGRITARREIAIPNASIRTIRGKIRSVRFSAAQIAELSANTHDAAGEAEQRRRSYITIASRCASNDGLLLSRGKRKRGRERIKFDRIASKYTLCLIPPTNFFFFFFVMSLSRRLPANRKKTKEEIASFELRSREHIFTRLRILLLLDKDLAAFYSLSFR